MPPLEMPPLDPSCGYEIYATLCTPQGEEYGVPLDVAMPHGKKRPGSRFYLLGSHPSHTSEGFGLSGRDGRTLALAQRHHPGQGPQVRGSSAFIAARYQGGERLIGPDEIAAVLG